MPFDLVMKHDLSIYFLFSNSELSVILSDIPYRASDSFNNVRVTFLNILIFSVQSEGVDFTSRH